MNRYFPLFAFAAWLFVFAPDEDGWTTPGDQSTRFWDDKDAMPPGWNPAYARVEHSRKTPAQSTTYPIYNEQEVHPGV